MESVPVKISSLGNKTAIVVEILITWLLGFAFMGCYLSRAQRREGETVGIIFSQEREGSTKTLKEGTS